MGLDAWLTIGVILVALALFVSEVVTVDLAALIVMSLLLLLGLVDAEEGISGFSNPATITVLCMFILSAGIERTGLVDSLARLLGRFAGGGPTWTMLLLLAVAVPLSAFINNTAAVAVLLPLALSLSRERGIAPSKLLMPLSFGSIAGGLVTVIGTSTNVLGSSISGQLGHGEFGLFEFAAPGAILALVAAVYLLIAGRWLLPARGLAAAERYGLHEYLAELSVGAESPLVGRALGDPEVGGEPDVQVVRRFHGTPGQGSVQSPIAAGDILLVLGPRPEIRAFAKDRALHLSDAFQRLSAEGSDGVELFELVVTPGSSLVGSSLDRLRFGWWYGGTVVALRRRRGIVHLPRRVSGAHLNAGDALLVLGTREDRERFRESGEFEPLGEPGRQGFRRGKAWIALLLFGGVVTAAATGLTSILVAAVTGATLMAVLGVLKMDELHRAIRWDVLFLLAGLIPLGIAVEKCGIAAGIAGLIERFGGGVAPFLLLTLTYFVTMLLTALVSNSAAVVLLAPIAASAAVSLGLDPRAFILAVCFGSSTDFLTPFGYQTNAMIYGPGGYRFADYFRLGWPLTLIYLFLAPWVISRWFPLAA